MWYKRCSHRNALLRIPSGELAVGSTADRVLAANPLDSPLFTARPCFPQAAPCHWQSSEGASASSLLYDTGILGQATLAQGHPIGLAQPFLELHSCLRPFLTRRPSFLLSCHRSQAYSTDGRLPRLILLPPLYLSQFFNKSLAHLILFRHLLLKGLKLTQKLMFMDQY